VAVGWQVRGGSARVEADMRQRAVPEMREAQAAAAYRVGVVSVNAKGVKPMQRRFL